MRTLAYITAYIPEYSIRAEAATKSSSILWLWNGTWLHLVNNIITSIQIPFGLFEVACCLRKVNQDQDAAQHTGTVKLHFEQDKALADDVRSQLGQSKAFQFPR